MVVQYGSLLAVALMLVLFPRRVRGARPLIAGLLTYGLAKGFEMWDAPIFTATRHALSGHTLKHLAAAVGLACVLAATVHGDWLRTAADQPRA